LFSTASIGFTESLSIVGISRILTAAATALAIISSLSLSNSGR
jgi:hypothetical protein